MDRNLAAVGGQASDRPSPPAGKLHAVCSGPRPYEAGFPHAVTVRSFAARPMLSSMTWCSARSAQWCSCRGMRSLPRLGRDNCRGPAAPPQQCWRDDALICRRQRAADQRLHNAVSRRGQPRGARGEPLQAAQVGPCQAVRITAGERSIWPSPSTSVQPSPAAEPVPRGDPRRAFRRGRELPGHGQPVLS